MLSEKGQGMRNKIPGPLQSNAKIACISARAHCTQSVCLRLATSMLIKMLFVFRVKLKKNLFKLFCSWLVYKCT